MNEVTSFLNRAELEEFGFAAIGSNLMISRFAKFYKPEFLTLGSNVRVDDFSIISVGAESSIGDHVHISAQTGIFASEGFSIGSFSTISGRVGVYGQSDDYSGEWLTNPTIPGNFRKVTKSFVSIGDHVIIGSNSTILPGARIAEGVAVGANSLVSQATAPWGIYAGTPARRIKERSQRILDVQIQLSESELGNSIGH